MLENGAPFSFLSVTLLEHVGFIIAVALWRGDVAIFLVIDFRRGRLFIGRGLGWVAPRSRIHSAFPRIRLMRAIEADFVVSGQLRVSGPETAFALLGEPGGQSHRLLNRLAGRTLPG